jgi:SAM-dependent methyltransferase
MGQERRGFMHPTAMANARLFFDTYCQGLAGGMVLDIGAQDVNGSLRAVCPARLNYVGVDFVEGKGVDVVLRDPYALPFEDASVDVVVSSSCFEHSEMFWLLFLEIVRVLKSPGLFYLNVPSNGAFHRYPVDCWRFYPDSGKALVTWAQRNKLDVCLLESYTSRQNSDIWNDYVAVFLRGSGHAAQFPNRITTHFADFTNGRTHSSDQIANYAQDPEDLEKLKLIGALIANQIRIKT